ncbi:hypothetical protein VMCG_09815 [Cytospora schulzeri]|uniref:Uncharacterized protein n=1 Tax=Cytospora schulzeri TaxID=448051 RepID=A0A423VHK9_9PEZI|nr:hypothetical protein VMCG_09815 [Valsa malicola]
MARTASKRASNGGKKPAIKIVEVADGLFAAFERIKPVNGIYQQVITRGEAPDLYMLGEVGIIALPLVEEQARKIVNAAIEGECNVNDTDAWYLDNEPASVFGEGTFDITNPPWEKYVQELAKAAAEGLGLDEGPVTPALDGMWFWTENCDWTTPPQRVRAGGDRRTWTAKMLIILPSAHKGGEITHDRNGHVESYPTADYRESTICWHKDIQYLDFKAPTRGNRLGLLYDLHVAKPTPYNKLRGNHHSAVQALQNAIEKYTNVVRNDPSEQTAFFLPLMTKIPKGGIKAASLSKNKLLPSDLAKVECFSEKGMDEIRGFCAHLALVALTQREVPTFTHVLDLSKGILGGVLKATGTSKEYILGDMVNIDGGNNLGGPLKPLKDAKFNKESVLDADAFASGLTRLVTRRGDTEEHIFVKTVLEAKLKIKGRKRDIWLRNGSNR